MARGELTDAQWERLQPLLPLQNDPKKRGRRFKDHRTRINAILWIDRTGAPWRDLHERYGPWQFAYDRFWRWSHDGTWTRIMHALQQQADSGRLAGKEVAWEGCAGDSTTIKAHPHAGGMALITRPGTQKNRRVKPLVRFKMPEGVLVAASAWDAAGEE